MGQQAKTPKTPKPVTKSIRLTLEEAEALADLVEDTAYAEAALMRQWVLEGMEQFRIRQAMGAYQEGILNLHQAAEKAQLPVAVLLEEMASYRVAVLEDPRCFGPGLEFLRRSFRQVIPADPEASSDESELVC